MRGLTGFDKAYIAAFAAIVILIVLMVTGVIHAQEPPKMDPQKMAEAAVTALQKQLQDTQNRLAALEKQQAATVAAQASGNARADAKKACKDLKLRYRGVLILSGTTKPVPLCE